MNVSDLVVIIILVMFLYGLVLFDRGECPPCKPEISIQYTTPPSQYEIVFSEDNAPSKIYGDLFTKGTPWIGGFELGLGKTYKPGEETQPVTRPV